MMMKPIAREVQRAIDDTKADASRLSEEDSRSVIQRIQNLYTEGKERWPLWEHIRFPASTQNADAWRTIGGFVGATACLLFFNPFDATDVFEFATGEDLTNVLGETFGFEFYVADRSLSYCICFNHHDMLLGIGRAEAWVAVSPRKP